VRRLIVCLLAGATLGGCVQHRASPTDGLVSNISLDLLAPLGSTPEAPNQARQATFNLTLWGDDGLPFPGDAIVDVYISFSGTRTGTEVACGERSDAPIETLTIRGGRLENHDITLPSAFGATSLWAVERGSNVVGASNKIYFPNPTIPDIATPPDPNAINATFCTNFEKKFVRVDRATGSGDLLVDSVFGNAVTVTDTGATEYRSLYLFTFGRPSSKLVPGRHVRFFNGNISKFVGFTEVNFPVVEADLDREPEPSKLPAPVKLAQADIANLKKLNGLVASVVEVSGKVCPLLPPNPNNDPNVQSTIDQWLKYNTFILGNFSCDSFTEFAVALPAKVVGGFDPANMIGQPAVIRGMLKNSSGQNPVRDEAGNTIACSPETPCTSGTCTFGICKRMPYNFWTVTVRGPEDVP
jgi:hypothetical protein